MVLDYTVRPRKIKAQEYSYSHVTFPKWAGLCGPNILEYLEKIDWRSRKKIYLFELDPVIFARIKEILGNDYPTVHLYNENILKHLWLRNTYFDLDFCKSIEDIRDDLPAIMKLEEFSLTVAFRPFSGKHTYDTIRLYAKGRLYYHDPYRDGMSMVMFTFVRQEEEVLKLENEI